MIRTARRADLVDDLYSAVRAGLGDAEQRVPFLPGGLVEHTGGLVDFTRHLQDVPWLIAITMHLCSSPRIGGKVVTRRTSFAGQVMHTCAELDS